MSDSLNNNCSNNTQVFVLFGATGDLSLRKIFPAWYQLQRAGLLAPTLKILAVGRNQSTSEQFRQKVSSALATFAPQSQKDIDTCQSLIDRIDYIQLELLESSDYIKLKSAVESAGAVATYYLATPPSLIEPICENLNKVGAVISTSKIVAEKPIGCDLASSKAINDKLAHYFDESQIYRIDHYLGKETVQNLIALRFGNSILANQWSHKNIDYVEITAVESVGIEDRWGYYDDVGQMRDMIQGHLLQLLCLVAMEPPAQLNAQSIRNEKEQVLQALRPISSGNIPDNVIRGQYGDGQCADGFVPGYLNEVGAKFQSETETFICIRAEIDNWRWSGTPFYLRTGKRMSEKITEIVVHFKPDPHHIFDADQKSIVRNTLIIRLQPTEGISLQMLTKSQGIEQGMRLRRDPLHLDFIESQQASRIPDAYERLLFEALKGDQSLFVGRNEVELAWAWCDQVIGACDQSSQPLHPYPAGSSGPIEARQLIQKYGHQWYEDQ